MTAASNTNKSIAVLNGIPSQQQDRYEHMRALHREVFQSQGEVLFINAPGRIEICGNHTDHNNGIVMAAAVSLDTLAAVTKREDSLVTVHSEGHDPVTVDLASLAPVKAEQGSAAALVRGVAHWMEDHGYALGGFDAVTTSRVLPGSGLSSSAAFEVLICAVFDALYNHNTIDAVRRAQCSQYAENVHFGKPSGLMDQMASSVGSMVRIDFETDQPDIQTIQYDFETKGYSIVVVNTGGSHNDLTHFYASIPQEMQAVAQFFGKTVLREVSPETFFNSIEALRAALPREIGDRAILRAQHYYDENERVDRAAQALKSDDLQAFFDTIIESGRSSALYLQNTYATPDRQEMMLGLMIAERMLRGKGAWRVHGGGFAGTTLNFVPTDMLSEFVAEMESVFGAGSATVLSIRPYGPAMID